MNRFHFLFTIWAVILISCLATASERVCTITLNSADEKEIFKSKLPYPDYSFTEILDGNRIGKANWLDDACDENIQCDILIISGHFVGQTFFGNRLASLKLLDLQKHVSKGSCSGLTTYPKQVFLFGCNTLRDDRFKEVDSQYVSRLIDEGYGRLEAELATQADYGFGFSNRKRMEYIFKGAMRIYGFFDTAPLGNLAAPVLATGLPTNPSLGSLVGENIFLVHFAKAKGAENSTFERIFDERISLSERLLQLSFLMKSKAFEIYLPYFIELATKGTSVQLSQIRNDTIIKSQILSYVAVAKPLLTKFQVATFASSMGWLEKSFRNRISREAAKVFITANASPELADLFCRFPLPKGDSVQLNISEIETGAFMDPTALKSLYCIGVTEKEIQLELLRQLNSENIFVQMSVGARLKQINIVDLEVIEALRQIADSGTDDEARKFAAAVLASH